MLQPQQSPLPLFLIFFLEIIYFYLLDLILFQMLNLFQLCG